MKKGINQWAFLSKDVRECIKKAKEVGFEGIELDLDEEGEISFTSKEKDLLEIKKFASDTGIKISSICTGLFWKYPLISKEKKVEEKAKDVVKKMVEIASLLEADTVLVIPGVVGSVLMPPTEIYPYDMVYKRSQEILKNLAPFAKEHKVYLGIENVWNKFLLSPLEMRNFIDEIQEEYVQVYFDVGNVMLFGYPEQWIRILGRRIKKVHFKDFLTSIGTLDGFVGLLHGDVNWKEVMKAFKEIRYEGFATGEYFPYKFYGDQLVEDISRAMDKIFERK